MKALLAQRDAFFGALYKIFKGDRRTMLISADNGAKEMDNISALPDQFRNVGIAEEQAVGMACGHALKGRKVWVCAIDPFVTLRCLEFVKLDVCAMNLPITLVGVGAGYAYDVMGPTHHGLGVIAALRAWPNLTIWSPADNVTAQALAEITYQKGSPQYIRFDRGDRPDVYVAGNTNFQNGLGVVRGGGDIAIVATGIMVHQALKVAHKLEKEDIRAKVIDLFCLKPLNADELLGCMERVAGVVTLEEDFLAGGMSGAVAELFVDEGFKKPVLRIGQSNKFAFDLGGREAIWEKYGLHVPGITKKIREWYRQL